MPVWPKDGRPEHWCRWCGGEIVHGRVRQRGWHDGREDDPNCLLNYRLHTDRKAQFAHVSGRDGLKCWDCSEAPEKWLRGYEVTSPVYAEEFRVLYVRRWTEVQRVTALELEHSTPLWAVSHLSDEERRFYFGPDNLRLRCPTCHGAKTKREAGARAKTKRLEKARLEPDDKPSRKPWGGRALPSKGMGPKLKGRGFSGKSRPLRSRNDLGRR